MTKNISQISITTDISEIVTLKQDRMCELRLDENNDVITIYCDQIDLLIRHLKEAKKEIEARHAKEK